jgi:hypothetical protein
MPKDSTLKPPPQKIRAYRQAPWREQTRLLTIGLSAVLGLMAMLGLFIFTGAQAAEAGLRVQSLIRDRDGYLRTLELQQGKLARLQSTVWMHQRALALGFVPATADDLDYLELPPLPAQPPTYISPTSFLNTEPVVSLSPAYKETLLEWILRMIHPAGGQ